MIAETHTYKNSGKPGFIHTLKISPKKVKDQYAFEMKEVIFVIDVSASMTNVLPYIQDSLRIFNELLGEYDIGIHLIVFSNKASHVASSRHGFIEAVNNLKTELLTNMGDGLNIAFDIVNNKKASWIVVLTDGESNQGYYQTASDFKELVSSRLRKNTKIVSIGYGKSTDPDVLSSIGEYVCVFERDDIIKVMGALYHEITTASIINLTIQPNGDYVSEIGSTNVGVLFNDRVYIYACANTNTSSNTSSSDIHHFCITYTEIKKCGLENIEEDIVTLPDTAFESIPDEIMREHFFSKASRLIEEFYRATDKKKEMERIESILSEEKWDNKEAEERVRTIMNMFVIDDDDTKFIARFALYSINSLRNQISHIDEDHLTSSAEEMQCKFKKMKRNVVQSKPK